MKKRITLKDWTYIGQYNPVAEWARPIASYTLEEIDGGFRRECKIPMWWYLIMFIPLHLLELASCVWDGGLKSFEVEGREIANWTFHRGDLPYERAKEIYKN